MTEPSGSEPQPRQGWLTRLPDEQQRAFQEGTVLIEILTGRAREQADVLQQLSEEFDRLAVIAGAAPTA